MTDTQLLIGIMQNDNRSWRYICRNMKPGFSKILGDAFALTKLTNEDIEDIFQESLLKLMEKVKGDFGYNARTDEYVNMFEAGGGMGGMM